VKDSGLHLALARRKWGGGKDRGGRTKRGGKGKQSTSPDLKGGVPGSWRREKGNKRNYWARSGEGGYWLFEN